MTIKTHDEYGFTVFTTKGGEIVGEATFDYTLFAGETTPLGLAAIRNGVSQWLTDTGAGKDFADAVAAFKSKAEKIAAGKPPADSIGGRGAALSDFDRELSAVVESFLRKRGEKVTKAKELAREPLVVATSIGAAVAKAKRANGETADEASVIDGLMSAWKSAAQKRLDDLDELPGL
jgi:hypothetical protein